MDIPDMDDLLDELEKSTSEIMLPPSEPFYPSESIDVSGRIVHLKDDEMPNSSPKNDHVIKKASIDEKESDSILANAYEELDGESQISQLNYAKGEFSNTQELNPNQIEGEGSQVLVPEENGVSSDQHSFDDVLEKDKNQVNMEKVELTEKDLPISENETTNESNILDNSLSNERNSVVEDKIPIQEQEMYVNYEEEHKFENVPNKPDEEPIVSEEQDDLVKQMAEVEEWIKSMETNENMVPMPKPVHLNSNTPYEEYYHDLPKTSDIDEHESHEIDFKTQSEILKLPEEKLGELLEETSEIPPDLVKKPETEKTIENHIEEQSSIEQQEQIEKEVQEEFHRYMDKIVHEAFSEAMNHVEEELDSINERAKPNDEDDEPQGTSSSYVIQDHVHLPENIEVITITDTETPDELENFNEEGQNLNTTDLHEPSEQGVTERKSVVESTHDISVVNTHIHLTESELQLGKAKPIWIPDSESTKCMICSTRFTVLYRRHHCRSCGRVLCANCCTLRRALPYVGDSEKKQRICEPCNRTLDRIDEYEKDQAQKRLQTASTEASLAEENTQPTPGPSSEAIPVQRKKSVLKKRPESYETETAEADGNFRPVGEKPPKRSVVFRDGISPGEDTDNLPTTSNGLTDDSSPEVTSQIKKLPKRNNLSSRRVREKRAEEEQLCLIHDDFVYLVDIDAELHRTTLDQLAAKLSTGLCVDVAIKRNLHAKIQLYKMSSYPEPIWFISTRGFNTIGVDELVIIYEVSTSNQLTGNENPTSALPLDVLKFFDRIFMDALSPINESLDEKVGIRRCINRINRFYALPSGQLHGIDAAGVIFQRPYGQNFDDLPIPSTPFLVGILVKSSEIVWTMACYNRLLYCLGMKSSYYPFPIVNPRNRDSMYTKDTTMTVLKVFNDFKNWSYRVSRIPGSVVSVCDKKTQIIIPSWMKEEIKTLVESNRSMICWILDFNDQADSCFVCEQKGNGGYTTHIFTNGGKSRRVTGASFVIFDGALKHSNEKFIVTVIEDGIVVRMQSETMDEAVRCLLAGQNFHLESSSMVVDIIWEDKFTPVYNTGALISPIDGSDIGGKYQYGLVLHRQFRSMNFIPTANEWALRLSTVINMEDGKFPSVLQPKYFDICEQMAAQIATTIAPFIGVLVANNHRFVAIRVRIDTDNVTYDTAKWPGMEDEHFVWTVTLDDQIIPYLYNLCAILPSGFHVEMHMPIVSARSLPIGDL